MAPASPGRTVRVAAAQASPVLLDLDGTLARLDQWTARAAAAGARLVAFPESWIPGYPVWLDLSPGAALWGHRGAREVFARLLANAVEIPGPAADRIGEIARSRGVTLVVGVHERAGRSLYNAVVTWGPDGRLLNRHRKLMPTHGERLVWGLGDGTGLRAVDTPAGRVGALICWEHWMPLARQALHDSGEQIHIAAWPTVKEMLQIASRHYAHEGRTFVLAAGSILHAGQIPSELRLPDGMPPEAVVQRGGSAIIAPDGRYLAEPVYDAEAIITAELDLDMIIRESMALDVTGHYSRPDVFDFSVHRTRK